MIDKEKNYENPTLEEVTLGALLHDIGKFAQRAGEEKYKTQEMQGLIQKLDPKTGRYTHEHALYTYGVIESLKDNLPDRIRYQKVARLAASHHQPSNIFEKIIQYGDSISAGIDRKETADTETNNKQKKFFEVPLECILDQVNFPDKRPNTQRYYSLAPLEPDVIFASQDISIGQKDYKNLWNQFYEDLKQLNNEEYENYLDALLTVCERYLWCIPSSTVQEPDISLYDHAVTTAAFSTCLYHYYIDKGMFNPGKEDLNYQEPAFLFIQGDVSGIQTYIFDLKTAESNAKLLRARSFEIELLCQQTAQFITNTLNLPRVCVLTNAGGQFLLVAPNSVKATETIPTLRKTIEKYFLSQFLGELSLNISEPVSASMNDLKQQKFPQLLKRIKDSTIEAKQRKFASLLTSIENHILQEEYNNIQKSGKVCPICEQRSGEVEKEQTLICKRCNRLIKIGEKLPKSTAIRKQKDKVLGVEEIHLLYELPDNSKQEFAFSINKYKVGFGWYHMPYYIPKNENGTPLTFEELAGQAEGTKKIAMFKADVDNLGAIFSIDLKDRMSISRYATLSRNLHYFFSTYLNHLIENRFNKDIYTVFSGGDDVCVIGPWNKVIEFTLSIHKEFQHFVGNNPSITLSAGVSLANSNLPVRNLAHEAEEALKKSKEVDPEMKEKNKITMFDTTVKWSEFQTLMEESKKLYSYLEGKKVSQAFFYRLLMYHEMNNLLIKNHKNILRNALWQSHFYYDLARNLGDSKYESERNYLKEFVHNNIQNLRIPVSCVLYRARKD